MPIIMPFDSFEELSESLAKAHAAADAQIRVNQMALMQGGHAAFVSDDLPIFGEVWSLDTQLAAERRHYPDPFVDAEQAEEWEWTRRGIADSHRTHSMFGRWYSVVVPKGELGYNHLSMLIPITKVMFEQAEQVGFSLEQGQRDDHDGDRWALALQLQIALNQTKRSPKVSEA